MQYFLTLYNDPKTKTEPFLVNPNLITSVFQETWNNTTYTIIHLMNDEELHTNYTVDELDNMIYDALNN